MKGVSEEELKIIESIIASYKTKYDFFAYGSRVKGNFRELSDLDIMIMGNNPININDIEELKEKFDNSKLPYIVNFVDFSSLTENFYNMIKNDLIKI